MANEEKIIKITIDDKEALVRIDNISKQLDTLGKNDTATKKALILEQKLLIKNLVEEEKLQQQRIKTLIESEKLDQKKIQTTNAANKQVKVTDGYLNELRESVQSLEKAYFQLTEAEYKNAKTNVVGTKGAQVLTSLKEQRAALAEAEAAYGKHNLNVGNYSSATKMLGINLGQVMKEMPNFAISARIGIMSLTNNLPMLAESIKAVRLEQQQLIAAGQKAPSMFGMITKSIFGLTGIMSIAMVLLQIYGADIIKWVGSLFTAKKAVNDLSTAQGALNNVMAQGGAEAKQKIDNVTELGVKIRKYGDDSRYAKDIIEEFNSTFDTHYKTIDEIRKVYPQLSKDFIDVALKMAAANDLIAQSTAQTVRQLRAENILSTYSKQQVDEATERLDGFFNKIRENLKGQGLSENEIVEKVNNIANAIKNGDDLQGFWVKAGWNGFDKGLKDARNTIRALGDDPIVIEFFKYLGGKGGEEMFKSILNSRASGVQIKKLKDEIAKLYSMEFSLDDQNIKGLKQRSEAKKTFDYEGELRELTAKQETDDFKKRMAEIEKYFGDKKAKYDEAYKDELLTKQQYETLMLELNVTTQNQQVDAYDDYIKKIAKIAQAEIDKANQEWEKFRNKQKDNILIISKTELQKQQQDYNLAVFKNTDELNDAQKLRKSEYWNDIAELDKQNLDKNSKEYQLAKKSIDDKYYLLGLQDEKYYLDKKTKLFFDYANTIGNILNSVSNFTQALGERELQNYAKTIQGKANYDELYARKKAEIERRNAIMTRSVASFDTIVNTAAAIMEAAPNLPLQILQGVLGATQLATIWAQPLPSYEGSSSGRGSTTTTQVTEKFHTGGVGEKPDNIKRSDEITKTLLLSERILSPTQTAIFDSMIGKVKSLGGSSNITSGVGVSDYLQESMLVRAFSVALQNQKPQQISWTEFSNQAQRQQQLQNNLIVR